MFQQAEICLGVPQNRTAQHQGNRYAFSMVCVFFGSVPVSTAKVLAVLVTWERIQVGAEGSTPPRG